MLIIVATMEIGVRGDGAPRHFIECDVLCGQIGRGGDTHAMAHPLRVAQRPAQGLHTSQTPAHHSREPINAKRVEQTSLSIDPILHRQYRKVGAIGAPGGRIGVHRAG
jgi:hypothetical protein